MANNFYSGPIEWKEGYYIHKHFKNIGKAEGQNKSVSDLFQNYSKQKEDMLKISKNIYKANLKNSLSETSLELLNDAFSNEDIMTTLHREMTNALQKNLAVDKITSGLNIQRELIESNVAKRMVQDINRGSVGESGIKAFNDLLVALNKTCMKLESEGGNLLASLLMESSNNLNAKMSFKDLGIYLSSVLNKYKTNFNGELIEIDKERVEQVISYINILAERLQQSKTLKTGKGTITANTIKNLIDNIFNTGFQESFGAMISTSAQNCVDNVIITQIGNIKSTGTNLVQMAVYDETGKVKEFSGKPLSGKADSKLENVKMTINTVSGIDKGEVEITIGLSNKAYRTQHIPGIKKGRGFSFSGGSGGTLAQAISDLYNLPFNHYLAYNIIAHQSDLSKDMGYLQDLILTRELTRIFSSRGTSDFAQFMIVNGQVISIWELIMETTKENILSSSQSNNNQAISLSIENRNKIMEDVKIKDNYTRIICINQLINNTTITAHIHADKLRNLTF